MITKPALQKILKGIQHIEEKVNSTKRTWERKNFTRKVHSTQLSIITLNVNSINSPVKRHRLLG
jgi:hypothetical protein